MLPYATGNMTMTTRIDKSTTSGRPRSLSLGVKLGAGFAVLTALSVMLGLFSLQRLGVTNSAVAVIRDNYLPSTQAVAGLELALQEVRSDESKLAMTAGDQDRAEIAASLQSAMATLAQRRTDYEHMMDSGEERQHYNVFDTVWPQYQQDIAQLQKLKDPVRDAATHDVTTASAAHFNALRDVVQWDMNYNQTQGKAYAETSRTTYESARVCVMAGIGLVLLLSVATALLLIRHISGAIAAMTLAMRRLADHDLGTTIPCVGRGDEIGAMAAAVQVFKDNMAEGDRLAAEQQAEQAARQQRSVRLEGLVSEFERQIGSTVATLASASTQMEATASSMTGNAAQTDAQAVAVAQAAAESSAGVQTVAAAAEELAASISEINHQVTSSASLTGRAVGSVRRTDDTVRALSESASRIGQVVELITSIASQTNLLALNATIEAARAGDAGRGFAVVASEVKSLAQQTARATDEIAAQIAQVQQASSGAVEAIHEIGGLIEEVGAITGSIAAAVEEQGAATSEIARNVQQTAANTQVVTSNIAGVSRAANDTGAAATEVLTAAGDLSRQAENLSAEVNSFISKVRVA